MLGAVLAGGLLAVGSRPAAAYPSSTVSLTGHGFGHGRGMGQWGALGDALAQPPDTYSQILSAFYGSLTSGGQTQVGALPNGWNDGTTPVRVDITANDGDNVIVTSQAAFTVTGVAGTFGPGQSFGAVELVLEASNPTHGIFDVYGATGCGGPWTLLASSVASPTITPVSAAAFPADAQIANEVLELCRPGGTLSARGSFQGVVNANNQVRTVNIVPLGEYVADVTPAESPTGWGSLGAVGPQGLPSGFQELEAQAVAARSYVMSSYGSLQGWFGYADICDSTTCQVYPGIADENATTDTAATDTANVAVLLPGGAVARTEYSSSTGGYSAGGTFAAVPDPGDAVCVAGACNTHHTWQAQVPVSAIQSAYPQIGTLISVGVSQRNGLGDLGGRVLQMTLQGSAGSVTVSGDTFASQFAAYGVQSDWFAVTSEASGGVGGYWMAATDGGVFSFGNAGFHGSLGGVRLAQPVVGVAATPDGGGYWMDASDGGVFAFGDAGFHGSTGGIRLNKPVVGMDTTPDGAGYWLVASDGGVFAFGDAGFHGSTGGIRLNKPVVGMARTPDGGGYWLVASDGGVFSFGDAAFHGSTGAVRLAQPVVGMGSTPDGGGYWLVASDGGVFAFGDAGFAGSLPGLAVRGPAVALVPTRSGGGYLVFTASGLAVDFGDAPQFSDVADVVPGYRGHIVGGATTPG
ncbi:MAG TPA: SpoIID/LytB domain-containing protein [Acidimicrobiales bacterium]|nr:SpoIID/LytB domain-containing protein [Acidimicrobiales bacterium]